MKHNSKTKSVVAHVPGTTEPSSLRSHETSAHREAEVVEKHHHSRKEKGQDTERKDLLDDTPPKRKHRITHSRSEASLLSATHSPSHRHRHRSKGSPSATPLYHIPQIHSVTLELDPALCTSLESARSPPSALSSDNSPVPPLTRIAPANVVRSRSFSRASFVSRGESSDEADIEATLRSLNLSRTELSLDGTTPRQGNQVDEIGQLYSTRSTSDRASTPSLDEAVLSAGSVSSRRRFTNSFA
ncbi:hypothetical protein J8273_5012 [Carpediemonas membranifera]|uniref:Uncharacterized protein n=1 Tax=Carpediemonas membranifera TaxID=201153 RepID=A0A8J6AWT8_9EUKA|nr:hypothetical protein J8273_5012 [Carpediemonas membranifera]|eukprot:KAG9393525.1 hypothetical protein J8273_5012 [Carpediemonas membranifera]